MSETFIHKFGGYHKAEARRWKNPDGTEGGIVAVSATVDPSVTMRETVQKIAYGLMADMAERGIVGAALRDVNSEMDGCITGMFDAVDIAIASQIEGLEAARKEERRVA